jgi:hypothetical protein
MSIRCLGLLGQHPIRRFEVFSGMRDERCVARMIDSFYSGDKLRALWVV